MINLMHQLKEKNQLRKNKVKYFKTKHPMLIEVGPYIVKTAETKDELIESFKLRFEVFHTEMRGIQGKGLDVDKFDYQFDHLIIIHKPTNKIIGTYRLNATSGAANNYTAQEFRLNMVWLNQGPYLELGRACIQKSHRKGTVISLLWRGIAEYMKLSGANVLYGCSTVNVNHARDAALIYKYMLEQGIAVKSTLSHPTQKYSLTDFDAWFSYFHNRLTPEQAQEAESLVPSLLKSYLKLGAKVICEPAYDEEFDCIDFLTVLKRENLSNSLAERFNVAR